MKFDLDLIKSLNGHISETKKAAGDPLVPKFSFGLFLQHSVKSSCWRYNMVIHRMWCCLAFVCCLFQIWIFGPDLDNKIWHLPSFVNDALIFDTATQERFMKFKLKNNLHWGVIVLLFVHSTTFSMHSICLLWWLCIDRATDRRKNIKISPMTPTSFTVYQTYKNM